MRIFAQHSLALSIAALSPFAVADSNDVLELVITASPFIKTGEAVNRPADVLSGDALQAAASATLGDTLNGQLGVSSASFGPGVGLPIIRGQSDNRVKVMQDSVGSMDASAASPDHAVTLEPLLATKIEVLRGPAALRYGSGAIGGVVNVLDNRIPDKLPKGLEGGAEVRQNSANNETSGVLSFTGAAGDLALHADAVKRDSDDLSIPDFAEKTPPENASRGHVQNTDAQYQAGTLGASYIGDDGFIGASVNKMDNNYGVPPDSDERVRIDMHQTRYDIKGELNNPFAGFEKLSAHLGHADYQHTEMEDGVAGTQFTNNAYEGRAELIHQKIADWKGALGLQTSHSIFAAIGEEAFIPKSTIESTGAFILEEMTQGNFTYELGARFDQQSITPENSSRITHKSTNFSGTTTWHFTDEQQINVGFAQSQRAPSVEELLADGPHPATGSYLIGDDTLNEETSNNLELGYHFHTEVVSASVNIFYNHFKDFIYSKNLNTVIDDLTGYQYTQADATFKGYEAEWKYAFNDEWSLRLFSDAVRARLDAGGDLPRMTPQRLGSEVLFDDNQWSGSVNVTHAFAQNHAGDNEDTTAAYTRVDARVSYTFKQGDSEYSLFLKGSNLLNAEIRNATSYLRDIAPEAGRGINIGLRVSF